MTVFCHRIDEISYRVTVRRDEGSRVAGFIRKEILPGLRGGKHTLWRAEDESGKWVNTYHSLRAAIAGLEYHVTRAAKGVTSVDTPAKPAWTAPTTKETRMSYHLGIRALDEYETRGKAVLGDPEAQQIVAELNAMRDVSAPDVFAIGDREIVARVGNRTLAKAITPRPEDGGCDVCIYRGGKMVAIARSVGEARRVLAEEARIALRVERGLDPR